jgi:multisubunit Na+/H+ antiporter MnhB subunit
MPDKRDTSEPTDSRNPWGIAALMACVTLGAILVAAGLDLADPPELGVPPVEENLEAAQVSQPVTAVLLNFRGYDTWLEVGVLVVAVLGLLTLHRARGLEMPHDERADRVLDTITRLLVPFMILIAGFLLWAGTRIPGGAFQAGAILGGAGVLLRVAGVGSGLDRLMRGRPLRLMATFGFTLFLLAAAGAILAGRQFLEYPSGWGGELILALEAGVTISIGWTLAFVYIAATPRGDQRGDAGR